MSDVNKTMNPSRRSFATSVAAALVASPVAICALGAQGEHAAIEPKPQTTPSPTPTPQRPPSPVAEAYVAVARTRFGKYLSDEEMDRVKRDLEGNVRAAEALAAVKLKNSDEPDSVFEA
jgi:hypothetical protein